MPTSTESKPQPLWAYNQLMRHELPQVIRPVDETEYRYFAVGGAIYDICAFTKPIDGFWRTDSDGVIAVQEVGFGSILVRRAK